MGCVKYEECNRCPVRNSCHLEVEPGSVMCSINKLQSEKTHGDVDMGQRICPYCGRPI